MNDVLQLWAKKNGQDAVYHHILPQVIDDVLAKNEKHIYTRFEIQYTLKRIKDKVVSDNMAMELQDDFDKYWYHHHPTNPVAYFRDIFVTLERSSFPEPQYLGEYLRLLNI